MMYHPADPDHPGHEIGVVGLFIVLVTVAIVAATGWFTNREIDQRRLIEHQAREIARLSEVCPPAEAGERLVSTVRMLGAGGSLRCIYTVNRGYADSTRRRPALPGGES